MTIALDGTPVDRPTWVTTSSRSALAKMSFAEQRSGTTRTTWGGNARQNGRAITNSGGQRVQNLVFPILVKPGAFELDADGEKIPVAPGMTVTVEVKTGSRRILEYVFSPLVEVAATSMRER